MGVITAPFSGLVVRWYSWISEQVMAKENNTWSFSSVVSGWTKVMKEHHSRASLAQRRRMFLHGLTKISPGLFFTVWLVPSKTMKFNHPRKFVPIRYTHKCDRSHNLSAHTAHRVIISESELGRGQYTAEVFNAHIPSPAPQTMSESC